MHDCGLQLVALTPPGLVDATVAIAASRAGALGMLNLEFVPDARAARRALKDLARYSRGQTGVKLSSAMPELLEELLPELPKVVLLTAEDIEAVVGLVEKLHGCGHTVWLEVMSSNDAAVGLRCGVGGLVAKGNEAGGWTDEETTFVLLQRLRKETALPVWAFGGIGLHTAAACAVAGAAGVVLDFQLALTQESTLPAKVKEAIRSMDGGETVSIGCAGSRSFRVYTRPRLPSVTRLQDAAHQLAMQPLTSERAIAWRNEVRARIAWTSDGDSVWPIGQDACFAVTLAETYHTVGGVIAAIRESAAAHIRAAGLLRPLDAGSPLAASHGTHYPIMQGPMTRVSDTPEFAHSVAKGGGLPFLALALMRGDEADRLVRSTKEALGSLPWGAGILGFIPEELLQEQVEILRRYRPPYVIIAGGRPDQAQQLEREGIRTYLHVPSPGLLRLFFQEGARRFIFEGRECGGHVGPRSSFVLWNSMIDVLLAALPAADAANCHVLFAGGVHDAQSAAMVAAMSAPLAKIGVCVGVLIGTAYLFTEEVVTSGAILPGFQVKALECSETVLVESGPGHAIRCVQNQFTQGFQAIKQQLVREGSKAEDVRNALEQLNVGRLRIASKGLKRNPAYTSDSDESKLISADEQEQHRDGMYMIGQVAALRHNITTIKALHEEIAVGATACLDQAAAKLGVEVVAADPRPARIAIVGMSAMVPQASDLATFWENILNKVYAITEVPKDRWDLDLYFDANRTAKDRIYSKWGGFLDPVPFDPLEFGMPPNSLPSIDPMQLLALKGARSALQDAGYLNRPFDRSRTSVILGASGGTGELGSNYNLRAGLPLVFGEDADRIISQTEGILPEWTEDSFAGLLPNVAAGRIANRFDLGGVNYVVDAACASSLAAVHLALKELEAGNSNMVIAGGIDSLQTPFGYMCFSKTHALSPTGQPRTFDATADGIVISEGFIFIVLKRLEDAERDGDRIYAVLQASAGSSDGKAKGLTAPRAEGQMLALERAYSTAGFSPATVRLFEAHGTGTVVGDRTEALALAAFLEKNGGGPAEYAVGSVKSMIGHTKAAAGVAGLVKAALSLYHKVLPATLGVTEPNPKARFGDGPLYVNSETRPWIHAQDYPRRAGISAFGFGGTNFHAVVEEYTGEFVKRPTVSPRWPSELLLWCAATREELSALLAILENQLASGARPELHDLAFTLACEYERSWSVSAASLAIVTSTTSELPAKLATARMALGSPSSAGSEREGIFYCAEPLVRYGEVALLFPGQGSQYPNMLRDLAIHFEDARASFELADRVVAARFRRPLSDRIFPPPAFHPEEEKAQQEALTATNVAQPALGAAEVAMLHILRSAGLDASMFAGHSYGEFVALYAAGVFDAETLVMLSEARGRSMIEAATQDLGTMAAVSAGADKVAEVIANREDVWLANLNAPQQTVISGSRDGVKWALASLQQAGIQSRQLPVGCAFHSPIVAPAQKRLAEVLAKASFAAPKREVFSNVTAAPYPVDPSEISKLLSAHLARPVRFAEQIEAMYAKGARIFVEAGPKSVLTGLVHNILGDRPHVAVATDMPGRSGITQLQIALAQLAVHGVGVQPTALFAHRDCKRLDLKRLVEETKPKAISETTWLVNGSRGISPAQPAPTIRRAKWAVSNSPSAALSSAPRVQPMPSQTGAGVPAAAPASGFSRSQPPANPATDDVMLQFQNLMSKFLDTQRQVMSSYLGRGIETPAETLVQQPVAMPAAAPVEGSPQLVTEPANIPTAPALAMASQIPTAEEIAKRLLAIVSERTGYPAEMLRLDADVEAELGIDSIKRVEIVGALQRTFLADRKLGSETTEQLSTLKTLGGIVDWIAKTIVRFGPTPAIPSVSALGQVPNFVRKEDVTQQLVQIVSDRTGYPAEMLGQQADLEADLGIDSIKRVEIVGALQTTFFPGEQLGSEAMEQLASRKTLGGIVDWIVEACEQLPRTAEVLVEGAAVRLRTPIDKEELTRQLLRIVSERTGYPIDMLKQDADFEAELGIDSIKRVEIIGALQGAFLKDRYLGEDAMQQLASIKTLGGIAQWMNDALVKLTEPAAQAAPNAHVASAIEPAALPRLCFVPVERPVPNGTGLQLDPTRPILLTDDGRGIAVAVAELLRGSGGRAVIVRAGAAVRQIDHDCFEADLTSASGTEDLLAMVGSIGGVVHLSPLANGPGDATCLSAWRHRLRLEVKSLFHILRAGGAMLQQTGASAVSFVLAVTSMGGTWGLRNSGEHYFPGHGAIAGLLKTAALEWPTVLSKAIDTNPRDSVATIAALLLRELASGDPEVQIGYVNDCRLIFEAVPEPLGDREASTMTIDSQSVILVTGGARGITAEVALGLAQAYKPKLMIAGRSPFPEEQEPSDTAKAATAREVKSVLIEKFHAAGEELNVAKVEAACSRILRDRDIRRNISRLRQAGGEVRYFQVDVCDERGMEDMVARIMTDYGRLDGVIHGAGIIEDKKIQDKSPESFDRVFDTKADSAFILSKVLPAATLKFCVLFSSVAAAYGNVGQCDYAAANEVLNKLAIDWNRRWDGRTVAIAWGPWAGGGMVDSALERAFKARGIQLIGTAAGYQALERELRFGAKADAAILIGGWESRQGGGRSAELPILQRRILGAKEPVESSACREPDSSASGLGRAHEPIDLEELQQTPGGTQ